MRSFSVNGRSAWAYVPLGAALVLASFSLRLRALLQTEFANGWDSYFYLVQLRSLVTEGQMHSPEWSLFYPLLLGMRWGCGDDLLAYKITAALLAGALTGLTFALALRLTRRLSLALLLGSFSVFSPHLTYFTAQYPKNLLGLVLFFAFLLLLDRRRPITSLLLGLANYFGHRLTFGLTVLFTGSFFLIKRINWKWLVQLLAIGGLLLGLATWIGALPAWADMERFKGILSTTPHLAAYSFIRDFSNRLTPFWTFEIIWTSLIYVLSLFFIKKNKYSPWHWSLFAICTLLIFPFFTWSYTGMAYRFFMVFVLLAPLLILQPLSGRTNRWLYLSLSIGLLLLSPWSNQAYQPKLHDADYAQYALLTQKAKAALLGHSVELIIAHNALAEYYTFTTGQDAMPWRPEYEIAPDRLWRIVADVRRSEMTRYLHPDDELIQLGVRYFLVQESAWQQLIARATAEQDDYLLERIYSWRNPHRLRPAFLLRKHKK